MPCVSVTNPVRRACRRVYTRHVTKRGPADNRMRWRWRVVLILVTNQQIGDILVRAAVRCFASPQVVLTHTTPTEKPFAYTGVNKC